MATLISNGSSPNDDWMATFQREACHTLGLCRSMRTSAPDEAEHVELLIQALEELLSKAMRLSESNAAIWNLEIWIKESRSLLSVLDTRLDPGNNLSGQSHADKPALRWQLKIDEVRDFVELIGLLRDNLRLVRPVTAEHRPPPAPAVLFMGKLNLLKDRLFPPVQVGSWVDISRLRRWLNHCDEHHSAHCQFSLRSKQIFKYRPRRLIDVEHLCLVPSKYEQRYVALSYVWGVGTAFKALKRNIARLQQERSLSGGREPNSVQSDHIHAVLPATIRNVIELTRRLGERFLWVDSLCIVQDDDEDRRSQLDSMGSIYANAYMTIVAAGGTAFTGLRGIEDATPPMARTPGIPCYLKHGNSFWLRHNIRDFHNNLKASAWNQRAWTFQEQIFSRRLLVWDDIAVAWECHCTVWLEGMEPGEGQCMNNDEVIAQGFSFGMQPSFQDYARHVTQFNRRELTYPEDALDAFGGILHILSSTVFVGGFICGLPVMFLDAALLWYNTSPSERRRAVRRHDDAGSAITSSLPPSWAWAAWGGSVAFPDYEHRIIGAANADLRPLVQWKYRANEKESWQPIRSVSSELLQGIHIEINQTAPLARSRAGRQEGHDMGENSDKIPSFVGGAGSHLLFARPFRAFFRAMEFSGEVQVLLSDGSYGCAGMLTSCELLGNNDNCPTHLLYEVVAVSESSMFGEDVYNVIWIEWEGGVAYRKGVGRILKSVWEAHKSERINLILG